MQATQLIHRLLAVVGFAPAGLGWRLACSSTQIATIPVAACASLVRARDQFAINIAGKPRPHPVRQTWFYLHICVGPFLSEGWGETEQVSAGGAALASACNKFAAKHAWRKINAARHQGKPGFIVENAKRLANIKQAQQIVCQPPINV